MNIDEITDKELNLIRTPMTRVSYDPLTGYPVYNNEEEYRKYGVFELTSKICHLVQLLNCKSRYVFDIAAVYEHSSLTEEEKKVLDRAYPGLSERIRKVKAGYNEIIENFYRGLL